MMHFMYQCLCWEVVKYHCYCKMQIFYYRAPEETGLKHRSSVDRIS